MKKLTTEDTENTEWENDLQCELAAWELLREAREQNAKLRELTERMLKEMDYVGWLSTAADFRKELEQLTESGK